MYQNILIPVDGSYRAIEAAEYGIELARRVNGRVTLCHVVPAYTPFGRKKAGRIAENFQDIQKELRQNGLNMLERMCKALAKEGINLSAKLLEGNSAHEICRIAREGQFDLVVMGEAGGYLSSTLTNRITQHAPCPVLVVR